MPKYAKWIGGGLGWALGGPIGALLGFVFGSMFDSMNSGQLEYKPSDGDRTTQTGDFTVTLLVLSAAVMKADGSVKRAELDYLKRFLVQHFGAGEAQRQILLLRELLKQEFSLTEVTQQVDRHMTYAEKLQLLHFLFGISLADDKQHPAELGLLERISSMIGITAGDYASVKAMFIKDASSAYRVLETSPNATDEEVKKAYRAMANKFHPDKVAHLGAEVQKAAHEKFQQLNAAYQEIKRQRGIT